MKEQMIINAGTESKICGASKKKIPLICSLLMCRGCGRRISRNGGCKVVHQIVFDLHSTVGRAACGQLSAKQHSELGRQLRRTTQ